MARTYLNTNDPVAALATPQGTGALAVIRCSGERSIELCARCFSRPRALLSTPGYRLVHGFVVDPDSGVRIDEVVASVYRGPHAFTGEDSVELSCHGSPAIVRGVLAALQKAGFSPALRGEFTFRAFLHGKADLVQAEAIDELVRAPGEAARTAALGRLDGQLSSRFSAIRDEMLDIRAETEAMLDYPEDEGVERSAAWSARLRVLCADLRTLSDSYRAGRLREEGALAVVAGRPNAGKSSLFNLLVREERAIVSPEPGTTRDWLESWVEIDGYAIRLVDTAGLRQGQSALEEEGVRRALDLSGRADVVIYLVDGVQGCSAEDRDFLESHRNAIKLWNKIDRPECGAEPQGWIGISAKESTNLGQVCARIAERLRSAEQGADQDTMIASERQKGLVDACLTSVSGAVGAIEAGAPLDAVALSLREASDFLGQITGEIGSEEIFERIFGSFCLGK